VPFGEAGFVGPQDHRDMGELGHLISQGSIDLDLTGCVVKMVVAPDNVRDLHVHIIHHHAEVIGGGAVRAEQYQVVELGVIKGDRSLDQVGDHGLAGLRGSKP